MTAPTRICPFFIRTNSSWPHGEMDLSLELLARHYTGLSFNELYTMIDSNGIVPDRISDEVRKFCEAASTAYFTDKAIELVVWLMSDGSWQIEPFHGEIRGRKTFMNKKECQILTGVKSSNNILCVFQDNRDKLAGSFPYVPSKRIYFRPDEYLENLPPPIA